MVVAALLVMLLRFLMMMVLLFMVFFAHHGSLSFVRLLMVALLFVEVRWLGRICIEWSLFGVIFLNLWLWLLDGDWLRLIGLRQSAGIGTAIIFAGMVGRSSHIRSNRDIARLICLLSDVLLQLRHGHS